MHSIHPVKLQSLSNALGPDLAMRFCAPLAFYMLLQAAGYISRTLAPEQFCAELNRNELDTTNKDWSRPALSRFLRQKYNAAIVSWSFDFPKPDYKLMHKAGYIETSAEEDFYKSTVLGRSVEDIVRDGYPVIVTMKPGFGTPENKNIHAVIIVEWYDHYVVVIDPDARNVKATFQVKYVRDHISPLGAGSIVLPKL